MFMHAQHEIQSLPRWCLQCKTGHHHQRHNKLAEILPMSCRPWPLLLLHTARWSKLPLLLLLLALVGPFDQPGIRPTLAPTTLPVCFLRPTRWSFAAPLTSELACAEWMSTSWPNNSCPLRSTTRRGRKWWRNTAINLCYWQPPLLWAACLAALHFKWPVLR